MKLQKHWKTSLLAILGIGPGLMVNSALIPLQSLIQKSFNLETNITFTPTTIGLIAFALFIPLGPVLRHQLGVRVTYTISVLVFMLGSLLSAFSADMQWMSIGRFLQGIGTGTLLMMMIPLLVLSFPIEIRNLALSVLLGGFFGSAIMGIFLGNVAISYHKWRWIFYLASAIALAGLIFSLRFFHTEHHPERKHLTWDILGLTLTIACSVTALLTLNQLNKWFGSSVDLWVTIGGILLTLILFITASSKTENPVVSFKLIMHAKPLLAMLMTLTSNIVMALSLLAVQGLLRNIYSIPTKQLLLWYLCMFIGVAIAAAVSTFLYDKIGPGLLGFVGTLTIAFVLIELINLKGTISFALMPYNLTLLTAGIGMTVGSGLMGAALGGPLPDLVKRMTAVQFIRFMVSTMVTLIVSWYLKCDNSRNQQEVVHYSSAVVDPKEQSLALSMTYHDFFLAALIVTGLLMSFSLGLHLTGKGHKLAHKPHQNHELAN